MKDSVALGVLVLSREFVYQCGRCAVEWESCAVVCTCTNENARVVFVLVLVIKKIRTTRIELVTNRFPSDTDTQYLHTTVERSTNWATLGHNHIQTHTQSKTQSTTKHTLRMQNTHYGLQYIICIHTTPIRICMLGFQSQDALGTAVGSMTAEYGYKSRSILHFVHPSRYVHVARDRVDSKRNMATMSRRTTHKLTVIHPN